MDDQLADGARIPQADVLPGLAGIDRFVDAVALRQIAADAGFAGAGIDHVGIGRRDGKAADGRSFLLIEDGLPGGGAIGRFPNAAAGGAEVVSVGIAGDARRRQGAAAAKGADGAVLQAFFQLLFVFVLVILCVRFSGGGFNRGFGTHLRG